MQLLRYVVRPLSPWSGHLRSDTLYGLLLCRIAEHLGSDACLNFINAFRNGEPPFAVSSAVPSGTVFNPALPPVPRPLFREWVEKDVFRNAKKEPLSSLEALQAERNFRKEPYLPADIWKEHASSLSFKNLFAWYCRTKDRKKDIFCCRDTEIHVSVERGGRQRNDDFGGAFADNLTWYAKNSTFHIYAKAQDPKFFLEMFQEIGDLGFGRHASVGKGRFSVEQDSSFDRTQMENNGKYALLCSVCASGDMSGIKGWYTVGIKRGKADASFGTSDKAPVVFAQEGSVLASLPKPPYVLEGVHGNPSVVQIKQPLTLPCNLSEEEYHG